MLLNLGTPFYHMVVYLLLLIVSALMLKGCCFQIQFCKLKGEILNDKLRWAPMVGEYMGC